MTILEALTEANTAAGIKTFSFANLQEFNSFIDSFKGLDYPVNVIVPVPLTGNLLPSRTKDVLNIQGWMLTRIKEDTNNYRSAKIEDDYIHPMRKLAKKFLVNLCQTDIVDPEIDDIGYSIRPEYMFLATHVFGVSYTCNLPINSKICGC